MVPRLIQFSISHVISSKVPGGPDLGICPSRAEVGGLTLQMSKQQLKKYSPYDCLHSSDPIFFVFQEGNMLTDLNDDLDL